MPGPVTHKITANPARPGERLDRALALALPHLSRSRISALCLQGLARLNGRPAKAADKVRPGDLLELEEPPPAPAAPQPEALALEILFEDSHLAVVNKPPGMVVHPAPGSASGTLVNALLHHFAGLSGVGGAARPGIVHRLDKETSGCIVVAKDDRAHLALSAQFAGREVEKIYLALAARRAAFDEREIRARIGRHPVDRKKMAVLEPPKGREAVTVATCLFRADGWSLFKCRLLTGRTHQIRVHLKQAGHPLLGDPLYGGPAPGGPAFPDAGRVMLHAWRLGFRHPATGEKIICAAPIPSDFRQFFQTRGVPVPEQPPERGPGF